MGEDEQVPRTRRLHGRTDYPAADHDELWAALDAGEALACRVCGAAITIDHHVGQPLWRAAWPTILCGKGCTLLQGTFHVNLWPDG
jgi:hypothetical protein